MNYSTTFTAESTGAPPMSHMLCNSCNDLTLAAVVLYKLDNKCLETVSQPHSQALRQDESDKRGDLLKQSGKRYHLTEPGDEANCFSALSTGCVLHVYSMRILALCGTTTYDFCASHNLNTFCMHSNYQVIIVHMQLHCVYVCLAKLLQVKMWLQLTNELLIILGSFLTELLNILGSSLVDHP